jgi:hypothetical protein
MHSNDPFLSLGTHSSRQFTHPSSETPDDPCHFAARLWSSARALIGRLYSRCRVALPILPLRPTRNREALHPATVAMPVPADPTEFRSSAELGQAGIREVFVLGDSQPPVRSGRDQEAAGPLVGAGATFARTAQGRTPRPRGLFARQNTAKVRNRRPQTLRSTRYKVVSFRKYKPTARSSGCHSASAKLARINRRSSTTRSRRRLAEIMTQAPLLAVFVDQLGQGRASWGDYRSASSSFLSLWNSSRALRS